MSFFALKNLRRYKTCHVARPRRHPIEKILKYNTRECVDSENRQVSGQLKFSPPISRGVPIKSKETRSTLAVPLLPLLDRPHIAVPNIYSSPSLRGERGAENGTKICE